MRNILRLKIKLINKKNKIRIHSVKTIYKAQNNFFLKYSNFQFNYLSKWNSVFF